MHRSITSLTAEHKAVEAGKKLAREDKAAGQRYPRNQSQTEQYCRDYNVTRCLFAFWRGYEKEWSGEP